MKLNKNFLTDILLLLTITIVTLYNFYINNGLEKIFCETYFNYNYIKRPLEICKNNGKRLSCIGMPSGHAETITIFSLLLYLYKFIPLWLAFTMIFIISCQRIVSNVHSIFQVIMGIFMGIIYTLIYKKLNLSFYSFLIIFSIGIILILLCIYKLDKKTHSQIPDWVDPIMIQYISKKQNSPLYLKIISIYNNVFFQNITFLSWSQLEYYLDIIIDKIKKSGIKYDAVVGIKTGGAIISDYISKKLGLVNYKIKIVNSEYKCNKKPHYLFNDYINRFFFDKKYNICEGINEDLYNKNIILIDETISTGKTINEAYNYLKMKKVKYIYPVSIAFYKKMYKGEININYVTENLVQIWQWGYDN